MVAALTRRLGALVVLVERAARRLERGRVVPTLWGFSAGLLVLILTASLFRFPALALLGIVVAALGLILVGLGVGAAAVVLGRDLLGALGSEDGDPASCMRFGFAALFYTVFLPVIGWLLVGLAVAAGTGAVLEAALVRRPSQLPPL